MDWYGYVIITVALLAFFISQSINAKKQMKQMIWNNIRHNFGDVTNREYTYNEFERISHFFLSKKKKGKFIDNITWNDLDMDSIFMQLNNTTSSVGEENLYKMLRMPVSDVNILQKRDMLIDYFLQNEDEAYKAEFIFSKIGRTKSISLFDFIYRINELEDKNNTKHYIHNLILIASVVFFAINPTSGIMALIGAIAINVIAYYKYKADVENYFVCFKYLVSMIEGSKQLCELKIAGISEYNDKLNKLNKELAPSFKGVSLLTTNAMGGSLAELVMDYVRIITHIDIMSFNSMVKKLKANIDKIEELYTGLGEIEALYAIASYRKYLSTKFGYCCKPGFFNKPSVDATDIYHPLIDKPVANSINAYRGVLLTGSNASGKSTFLKTIAINTILAQTIYTCSAKEFVVGFCEVYSSMSLKDSIENNESYYMAEIKSLKRIMDKANNGDKVLCFVDEVLRGTNTVERISASSEILKSLCVDNVLCFAATHDIELTHILENYYDNYHFREEVKDCDILFNYKLFEGRATTRNAIKLLSIMGYNKEIINSAENRAIKFLETGKWE